MFGMLSFWGLLETISWDKKVDFTSQPLVTDSAIPQFGLGVAYLFLMRCDNALGQTNAKFVWNGESVAADNHFQRLGAADGVNAPSEGTTPGAGIIAGGTAPAADFSPCFLWFPWAYRTDRQRVGWVFSQLESAANVQQVMAATTKRTAASSGAITDAISQLDVSPSAAGGNLTGSYWRGFT